MKYLSKIKNGIKSRIIRTAKHFEPSKNKWSKEKLEKGVMKGYEYNFGYTFDINKPQLFTEKIQWYKINYEFPNMENIVDKFLFKDYIKEKLGEGYTIPLYGAWTSIDQLEKDWDSLPEEICLKSTLQSDGRCIKRIKNRSEISFESIKKELKSWLDVKNTLINSYCRAYYHATPRILAEKYESQLNDILCDYKFFCFNGKPFCMYVAANGFDNGKLSTISFYDLNWENMGVKYGNHQNGDFAKPAKFDQMLEIATKLSEEFPFVRVDFFETAQNLYVAELTLYPGGGFIPYYPESFNKQMGDLLVLPEKK